MKKIWLILYYGFARHLPKSNRGLMGSLPSGCVTNVLSTCLLNAKERTLTWSKEPM